MRAEELDDWKGHVPMMWGQLFFVHRHLTIDRRSLPFGKVAPSVLLSSLKTDMYKYFERSFAGHQSWIRNQVKLFGDQWYSFEPGD